jgi:hypothetical protein
MKAYNLIDRLTVKYRHKSELNVASDDYDSLEWEEAGINLYFE